MPATPQTSPSTQNTVHAPQNTKPATQNTTLLRLLAAAAVAFAVVAAASAAAAAAATAGRARAAATPAADSAVDATAAAAIGYSGCWRKWASALWSALGWGKRRIKAQSHQGVELTATSPCPLQRKWWLRKREKYHMRTVIAAETASTNFGKP